VGNQPKRPPRPRPAQQSRSISNGRRRTASSSRGNPSSTAKWPSSRAERLAQVKGTRKCTGYKDKAGKAASDVDLQLKETNVIIFERRTDKVLQKKVFPPDDRCPMFLLRRAGENTQESSIPAEAIKGWLKTQIQRRAARTLAPSKLVK